MNSQTKLLHAVAATPANVHDSLCLPDLLHGEETRVWGDSAYQGQREVVREHAPKARDFTHRRYRYKAAWPGDGVLAIADVRSYISAICQCLLWASSTQQSLPFQSNRSCEVAEVRHHPMPLD